MWPVFLVHPFCDCCEPNFSFQLCNFTLGGIMKHWNSGDVVPYILKALKNSSSVNFSYGTILQPFELGVCIFLIHSDWNFKVISWISNWLQSDSFFFFFSKRESQDLSPVTMTVPWISKWNSHFFVPNTCSRAGWIQYRQCKIMIFTCKIVGCYF